MTTNLIPMTRFISIPTLLLLSVAYLLGSMVEPAQATRPSRTWLYIQAACRGTQYRELCVRCLTDYARGVNTTIDSPQQLAQAALSVSLYRAVYTRAYMLKVAHELKYTNPNSRDYQTVKDCLAQITNGVYQLSQSIRELRRLGNNPVAKNFYWHISNIETWVSTTITDATMCLDNFPGRRMNKVKATIRGKVLNVAMVSSNALNLFHRFAAKYKAMKP